MVVHRAKGCQQSSRNIVPRAAEYDAMRKRTVIPIQEIKKECMMILHQKNVRLIHDVTSRRKTHSNSTIYLTAAEVAWCRLVADNRREKEEGKREHQIRQPPESCIFNKIDVKLFRNAKAPWTVYCSISPKSPCSSTSLTCLQTI